MEPFERLTLHINESAKLTIGATYTFVNQYASSAPDGVRRDQISGRADFTAAWKVYDRESNAGTISLLVRSGTNIGISQQFNLSDSLGSALTLNCLEGEGPQEPIMLNILYCVRICPTRGCPSTSARSPKRIHQSEHVQQ
jgi:porin